MSQRLFSKFGTSFAPSCPEATASTLHRHELSKVCLEQEAQHILLSEQEAVRRQFEKLQQRKQTLTMQLEQSIARQSNAQSNADSIALSNNLPRLTIAAGQHDTASAARTAAPPLQPAASASTAAVPMLHASTQQGRSLAVAAESIIPTADQMPDLLLDFESRDVQKHSDQG